MCISMGGHRRSYLLFTVGFPWRCCEITAIYKGSHVNGLYFVCLGARSSDGSCEWLSDCHSHVFLFVVVLCSDFSAAWKKIPLSST